MERIIDVLYEGKAGIRPDRVPAEVHVLLESDDGAVGVDLDLVQDAVAVVDNALNEPRLELLRGPLQLDVSLCMTYQKDDEDDEDDVNGSTDLLESLPNALEHVQDAVVFGRDKGSILLEYLEMSLDLGGRLLGVPAEMALVKLCVLESQSVRERA